MGRRNRVLSLLIGPLVPSPASSPLALVTPCRLVRRPVHRSVRRTTYLLHVANSVNIGTVTHQRERKPVQFGSSKYKNLKLREEREMWSENCLISN